MRSTVGIPSFPRKRWPKARVGEDVKQMKWPNYSSKSQIQQIRNAPAIVVRQP